MRATSSNLQNSKRKFATEKTRGSGNAFADIGVAQPEEALAKARIVETIADLLARRDLSQQEAGRLVGLTQPQVSRLVRGDTREFSYERLIRVLTALGQDVEITIREARPKKARKRARSRMTAFATVAATAARGLSRCGQLSQTYATVDRAE
jgi:predicted XRE-type DNA-binding protein